MSRRASYTLDMQQSMSRRSPNSYCRTLFIHLNVTTIQPGACANCIYLESVDIPPIVREIHQNAFSRCEVLRLVELSEGLRCIEDGSFERCPLTNIWIPSSVEDLHKHAFDCNLTVEFCEQIEALVTDVSLWGWWNKKRNRDNVFWTYTWMTKTAFLTDWIRSMSLSGGMKSTTCYAVLARKRSGLGPKLLMDITGPYTGQQSGRLELWLVISGPLNPILPPTRCWMVVCLHWMLQSWHTYFLPSGLHPGTSTMVEAEVGNWRISLMTHQRIGKWVRRSLTKDNWKFQSKFNTCKWVLDPAEGSTICFVAS